MGESVMEDGVVEKRLRKVTEPPPAMVFVAEPLLENSRPRRPTSWMLPDSSSAELVVLPVGSRHVRVQAVNVAARVFSWNSSNSLREKRKPPEKADVLSRAQALPFQAALSVNQMESLSA
jgi:hypothetical protein